MESRIIISGENLQDICIAVYGNLEAMGDLIKDNPILTSWTMNIEPLAGQSLIYDPAKFNILPSQVQAASKIESSIKNIVGQFGQSIYDIIMLTYASFDNFSKLITDNNLTGINTNGLTIAYDTKLTQSKELNRYMLNLAPAKVASLVEEQKGFILLENGFYLLQEDGFKIRL